MSDHRAPQRPSMIGRPSRRLLAVLTVLLVVAGTTWFTGATFVSGSNTWAKVGAADDYHPPKVTVTSPGTSVTGNVAISATASDTGSGVKNVVIQYAAAGSSTWTTLCTDSSSPYSCSWDTFGIVDGDYQLRAIATDNVGKTTTSAVVTTKVANPAAVDLATVADVVRGSVTLRATVTGFGSRTLSSLFEYRLSGTTGSWSTISGCATVTGSSPTCTWATGTLADFYDVKVTTKVGTTTTVTDEQTDVLVDNALPTTTLDAPTTMSGIVQVVATPVDEDSGVASVELSYRLGTSGTFTTLCTVATDPYRCAFDTTKVINGRYELRATATDVAGNTSAATVITRDVNNGVASITITSPLTGDRVTGTKTITTEYTTPLNVTPGSVRIEARLGNGTFTTVCVDNTAPFTCDWATATLASGTWELKATLTYGANLLTATSQSVFVTIDNTALRALDIQASNGGVLGKIDGGDKITFTYAGALDLTTIKSGWGGGSTALTVTLADKNVQTTTATDRATFSVPLGTVLFAQNYVNKKKTVTAGATMTASTGTVNGSTVTIIVVTFDPITSADLKSSTTAGALRWTPSATAKSTGGVACSTTPATETGATDKDL